MCGGTLEVAEGNNIAECEFCGTKQTVPSLDDEKKITLFTRANRLRFANEFDKAAGMYESIISDFPEEAEAYWGLVLCKYGIEYVDDPLTGRKIPTCHRVSYDSVMDDENLEMALEYSDLSARSLYREEAKTIEEIRTKILEVSSTADPYDIFICYKETDFVGNRTIDSVIAQDIYDRLTEKGYKVFFSRISLEDKLGQGYEPYIFAALNSAKVMLAIGTDYEYYNAVWVKNEWSRFLKLMASDNTKYLIPCYKDLDAYDMPKEFRHLQAQDLGKVGAYQDLLRGIEKIIKPVVIIENINENSDAGPRTDALTKRGYLELEAGHWDKAKEFFDQILNMDAECGDAYLGLFMTEKRIKDEVSLQQYILDPDQDLDLNSSEEWKRALRFSSNEKRLMLEGLLKRRDENILALQEQNRIKEQERNERLKSQIPQLKEARERTRSYLLAAGVNHVLGLKEDGTIVATGRNYYGALNNVSDWNRIVKIDTLVRNTVGLRDDGTVVATGDNEFGQCDVSDWQGITDIALAGKGTLGLKRDGTVIATNRECNVSGWTEIIEIVHFGLGLHKDGTVVATGNNDEGQCNISDWEGIVSIARGPYHSMGLRENGTVVTTGYNEEGQCNTSDWEGIVSIAAGTRHSVGLREDGTVVATGDNQYGQCDVLDWEGIVGIAACSYYTVALKEDGTVLATGDKDSLGDCDFSNWKLFYSESEKSNLYNRGVELLWQSTETSYADAYKIFMELHDYKDCKALKEECQKKLQQKRLSKELERRKKGLEAEKQELIMELNNLHGLFAGKRRKEIENRLAEIRKELE